MENPCKILVASSNRGKLREIQDILVAESVQLLLPADLGLYLEVEESGLTYAENAALKARAYCRASGLLTLADDSGLEVDALGGQPGLYSARYSPKPGATDADRRAFLLENLRARGLPRPWLARFRCAVVLALPGAGVSSAAEGSVEGEILPEERGSNGFGYDPLFYLPGLGRTMAELPEDEKNHLSHRARALQKIRPAVEKRVVGMEK